MAANFLKQDPNTYKIQQNAIYRDKTKLANFRGNPLYQATKRQVNNTYMVKNDETRWKANPLMYNK